MEIVKNKTWQRNSDGKVICSCGCQKIFQKDDAVLLAGFNNTDSFPGYVGENRYGIYHAACLEIVGARQAQRNGASNRWRRASMLRLQSAV